MIFRFPDCMGCIKDMVIPLVSFKEVEFYKSRFVFQISISGFPNFFKFRFLPFDNFESVHSNVRHSMKNEVSGGEGKKRYLYCISFMTWNFFCKSRVLSKS